MIVRNPFGGEIGNDTKNLILLAWIMLEDPQGQPNGEGLKFQAISDRAWKKVEEVEVMDEAFIPTRQLVDQYSMTVLYQMAVTERCTPEALQKHALDRDQVYRIANHGEALLKKFLKNLGWIKY